MWKDAKIIYNKVNSIPPVSEIPDGLTKDLYPYYLDKPYLNEYGSTGGGGNTSHDYVEIGGIKWATMNLGATAVTDYGKYYAWGDVSGYTADQVTGGTKDFDEEDYVFGPIDWNSPPDYSISKYNTQDKKTTLDPEDDAVSKEWGGNWRMPTPTEWQTLISATNVTWSYNYQEMGVGGLVCTDKTDSSKVLFLPAAGLCSSGSVSNTEYYGRYWSCLLENREVRSDNAFFMGFDEDGGLASDGSTGRYLGLSIRGVLDE